MTCDMCKLPCGKYPIGVKKVICWRCCQKLAGPPKSLKFVANKTDGIKRPKGWKFMREFVDSEGNVFHKGVPKPELKGTLPPTPLKEKLTKKQKNDKLRERQQYSAEMYDLKKELVTADKKRKVEIEKRLKQITKLLK